MAYKRGARRARRQKGHSLSKKVAKLSKAVRRNEPVHQVYQGTLTDYIGYNGLVTQTTGMLDIFNPALGTGFSNRHSPECEVFAIDLAITYFKNAASSPDILHATLLTTPETLAGVSGAVTSFNPSSGTAWAPNAYWQPSKFTAFPYRVIKDFKPVVVSRDGTNGSPGIVTQRARINLKGMKIDFGNGSPAIQHNLYLTIFGQQAPSMGTTSSLCLISYQVHYKS